MLEGGAALSCCKMLFLPCEESLVLFVAVIACGLVCSSCLLFRVIAVSVAVCTILACLLLCLHADLTVDAAPQSCFN